MLANISQFEALQNSAGQQQSTMSVFNATALSERMNQVRMLFDATNAISSLRDDLVADFRDDEDARSQVNLAFSDVDGRLQNLRKLLESLPTRSDSE